MDEYIKREDVYDVIRRLHCNACGGIIACQFCDVEELLFAIDNIPNAIEYVEPEGKVIHVPKFTFKGGSEDNE